MKERITDS